MTIQTVVACIARLRLLNGMVYSGRDGMAFYQEPGHYEKTIISELQGAWTVLREAVVAECHSQEYIRLLFHIDEAMSWESVRDLPRMRNTFILIQSLSQQTPVPDSIMTLIEDVREILYEVIDEISSGKQL